MKPKLRMLGKLGLALLLVSLLIVGVVPPAPVRAVDTAVTNVWVDFDSAGNDISAAAKYIINFTPTTALKRGVDTITVQFADGIDTTMGPASAAYNLSTVPTDNNAHFTFGSSAVQGDIDATVRDAITKKVTVTPPVDLAAGTAAVLNIATGANIIGPGTASNSYKIKVSTSKDVTPVPSSAFALDGTTVSTIAKVRDPSSLTAGAVSDYMIKFDPEVAVPVGGTVTVKLPSGSYLPSTVDAAYVKVGANSATVNVTANASAVTVDTTARTITATTAEDTGVEPTAFIYIMTGAGVKNPTTAGAYTISMWTSTDGRKLTSGTLWTTVAGAASKIAFHAKSDTATLINAFTGVITLEVQDANGNIVTSGSPAVTFTVSGSGAVYGGQDTTTAVGTTIGSGTRDLYLRDTVAETATITATTTSLGTATHTVTVAPKVQLQDSSGTLLQSYPTSTSSTDTTLGGAAIQAAITAATNGDKVVLGNGIYELGATIQLDKRITLTSLNGAASTTIKPTAASMTAVRLEASGTSTQPVIIDGLKFDKGLVAGASTVAYFVRAIFNNGFEYVTVRNNTFTNVRPSTDADNQVGGAVVSFVQLNANEQGVDNVASGAALTSGTISGNTFTSNNMEATNLTASKRAMINIMSKSGNKAISGVTVSGNTLTGNNGIGIMLKGYVTNGGTVTATISDNTITNSIAPINLQGKTSGVKIMGNTVSGGYMYALRVEPDDSQGGNADHDNLVIKKNSFTGTAGASSTSAVVRIDEDGGNNAVTLQYNDFTSNDATYSIYASSTVGNAVDAKYNYFGDGTGPAVTTAGTVVTRLNASGTGKKVSDIVTYYPWLHKSKADVVADNASYQAVSIALVSGWNTLSTPVKLISTADAIQELVSASDYSVAYYYNNGWQQITSESAYVLNPGDAVYIKMNAAKTVYLQFAANEFTAGSKSLAAGWNLIGLMSLATSMQVDNAVASVKQTAAGLPGYSQVISPSINALQTDIWSHADGGGADNHDWSYSSGATGTNINMRPGLGYWVYMQNAATLAGFEILPMAPDLN